MASEKRTPRTQGQKAPSAGEKKPEKRQRPPRQRPPKQNKTYTVKQKAASNRPAVNPIDLIPQYARAAWSKLERIPQGGLRRRWLFNSVGVVLLVAVLAVTLLSLFVSNYYYSSMRAGLESTAESASGFISSYATNEQTYLEMANYYVSDFNQSASLELQFLSTDGQVILTSYAISGSRPGTSEIRTAIETQTVASFIGKSPTTGERILAVSAPILNGDEVVGVIRLVSSCTAVDRQILMIICITVLVAAGIVIMMYALSLYFIQSIIVPVNSITQTAQRIAAGSYGIQMEKNRDDEIGALVDAINDMSTKISLSEKTKDEFISSVSHELRTPLTAINGWSQTLLSGEITDPQSVQKGLSIISSEGQRLSKLVDELLDFSRIEDGRFTLNIELMDIKAELEDAVFTYQQFFKEKHIPLIHHDCDEEFPPIPGDPARMRQVFSNLLDNAGKHGGDGKRVDTYIDRDDGMVRIRIRDYGQGIPEKDLPHVKEKFYRANTKTRGSGIGLAVCDEIVTRMGGTLDITNAEGGGCLATIHLPIATPAVPAASLKAQLQTAAQDTFHKTV
ncbi:MAG: HAMP domain-containing histidine kinase [Clostridiales bacterium]|nr:HAMP domain-containing histidine kinase [Clostridiales bacterium]